MEIESLFVIGICVAVLQLKIASNYNENDLTLLQLSAIQYLNKCDEVPLSSLASLLCTFEANILTVLHWNYNVIH